MCERGGFDVRCGERVGRQWGCFGGVRGSVASLGGVAGVLHEIFDGVGIHWDVCGEIYGAVFGKENIVFETDTKTLFGQINAGFDGEHPARVKWGMERSYVVDVNSQWMAQSVHEIRGAGGFFRGVFAKVAWFEKVQAEEFLVHVGLRFLMPVSVEFADSSSLDGGAHHAQYGVVDRFLAAGELAVHRQGTGEIRGVVGVFGTDIQ